MSERLLISAACLSVSLAPCYAFASVADLRLSYAQKVSSGMKVVFDRVATNSAGALASAAKYVSYVDLKNPRVLAVAASRVLTAMRFLGPGGLALSLVGTGAYMLYNYLNEKGYKWDPVTNTLVLAGTVVATVDKATQLTEDFLNNANSFFEGYFSIRSNTSSRLITGNSAQSVCSEFLASYYPPGSAYSIIGGCTYAGHQANTNQYCFNFRYGTTTDNYLSSACVTANTDVVTPAPSTQPKTVLRASQVADLLKEGNGTTDAGELPTNSSSDPKLPVIPANISAQILSDLFNPSLDGYNEVIDAAKSDARPALAGEVATNEQDIPTGSYVGSDAPSIALPQPGITTPTGETVYDLPQFCTWAMVVCEAAMNITAIRDYLTKPKEQDNTEFDFETPESATSTTVNFGGQCPANATLANFEFGGRQILWEVDFTPFCNILTSYVKPVVISIGAISAVYIVGGVRQDG